MLMFMLIILRDSAFVASEQVAGAWGICLTQHKFRDWAVHGWGWTAACQCEARIIITTTTIIISIIIMLWAGQKPHIVHSYVLTASHLNEIWCTPNLIGLKIAIYVRIVILDLYVFLEHRFFLVGCPICKFGYSGTEWRSCQRLCPENISKSPQGPLNNACMCSSWMSL